MPAEFNQETGSDLTSTMSSTIRSNGPAISEPAVRATKDEIEEEGDPPQQRERRITAYDRLSHDLSNDQKCLKEITLGKRIGFYRIRGELGSGNFSQVRMAVHALTKEKVAIKILDKTKLDQKTQRLLSREISSMERLRHPNIIRLYEVVETLAKLHIVMEYASGGELFTKISNEGKMSEKDAKPIFAQVVAALEHMHDHHIIHRDLKAENVFYAAPTMIKVGDFGFSTFSRADQTLNTFCGSPPYAAPELFKDESYYGVYVDIWALGILLYFMVSGIMPFRAETVAKLKKCILEGTYTIPSFVSDSGQFLIRSMLKPAPLDRFSIQEIKASEWLQGEEFPAALEPYELNPTMANNNVKHDEVEARKVLTTLGISDDLIKQTQGRDSRSSVTGTYRIILHRIQKRNANFADAVVEDDQNPIQNSTLRRRGKENVTPVLEKRQSKFCTIL
ncbi:serine/threonine-protein kinase NIM1-like [Lineus longissimus]|uniref:serine/threonine-protein kinase NIM1-like n=1 Tax=Lineus longissimus TaxID=88925 RepID=UPI00315D92A1